MLLSQIASGQTKTATIPTDIHIPGHSLTQPSTYPLLQSDFVSYTQSYTVIPYDYDQILQSSKNDIKKLIHRNKKPKVSLNQLIENVAFYFEHKKPTPYNDVGAMGEGNWCDIQLSSTGCSHIQQDLVYRTDAFNCVTLVNLALALVGSQNLTNFNRNITQISYGANQFSKNYPTQELSYRNRDNFISASFNPINNANHRLEDVTEKLPFFHLVAKQTQATITRPKWFATQAQPSVISNYVRVLNASVGNAMADKLGDSSNFDAFPDQIVTIDYIPKEILARKSGDNKYIPDETLINKIPTPSVVEIVRDVNNWNINGKNIQDIIGSGINVSHVGLLYFHYFSKGKTIYQQIQCHYNNDQKKVCKVTPRRCTQKSGCKKVMMLAATNAYPNGYIWSKGKNKYYCTADDRVPNGATKLTTCNRVMSMPLADYITNYSYGNYTFMDTTSILGINIEKINSNTQ